MRLEERFETKLCHIINQRVEVGVILLFSLVEIVCEVSQYITKLTQWQ